MAMPLGTVQSVLNLAAELLQAAVHCQDLKFATITTLDLPTIYITIWSCLEME